MSASHGVYEMERRLIALDGAVNFRDIGGYRTGTDRHLRWQRVYRSDSLAELTAADLQTLQGLGLYAISDFRLPLEREKKPDRLPEGHNMRLLTPGFIPRGTEEMLRQIFKGQLAAETIRAEVTRHYRLFATEHLGEYVSTFRMILEAEGRPVLLHCTSGKDRTGFGIALLMLAAGCDETAVTEDYLITNSYRRDIGFMFSADADPAAIEMLTAAQPEYIATALAALRQTHGAPDNWLATMGFDGEDRVVLRALLTEPA